MSEKTIILAINIFTLLILLIMQILIVKTSRKNILLGLKLPEDKMNSIEVKSIIKRYTKEKLIVGIPLLLLMGFLMYHIDSINLGLSN